MLRRSSEAARVGGANEPEVRTNAILKGPGHAGGDAACARGSARPLVLDTRADDAPLVRPTPAPTPQTDPKSASPAASPRLLPSYALPRCHRTHRTHRHAAAAIVRAFPRCVNGASRGRYSYDPASEAREKDVPLSREQQLCVAAEVGALPDVKRLLHDGADVHFRRAPLHFRTTRPPPHAHARCLPPPQPHRPGG